MRLSFQLEAVVSRATNCCFDSDTQGQFMRLSFKLEAVVSQAANCCFDSDTKGTIHETFVYTRSSCVSGYELLLWFRHKRDNAWDFRFKLEALCLEQRTVALIPTQRGQFMNIRFNSKQLCVSSNELLLCHELLLSDTQGQFMRLSSKLEAVVSRVQLELLLWVPTQRNNSWDFRLKLEAVVSRATSCCFGFRHTGTIHESFV